ncbi:MAG TPA: tyrosine-type recombinase/integrase [Planctomycetaceae bacterium]|jgi:integrase|nr:tyrosine-type recombinase/integrase [Planctomycetaceae bacterium]
MAVNLLMTWVPSARRWTKKHNGKWYAVSCRKLGVPETKEASWRAANDWWENQQRTIDTAPPSEEDLRANAIRVWSMVQDWKVLDEESREHLVDSLVGAGQYKKIKAQADAMLASATQPTPPNRIVKAQVDSWLQLLKSICQSGQMSEGRCDAYSRNIRIFVDWIGETTAIDKIDEAKLEDFFNHLSVQVGGERYSPNYAHTLLMTARQFISRLAELKLISLPCNIRSRRFRFNHSAPARIETFTVEEVREMVAAAKGPHERTKLFLLLMLNCGMYQNDIAELRNDEVDWTMGTISRARSKTRHRNGPVVTYKLWPETFALLKKYRSEGDLALANEEGNLLVRYWLDEKGKMRRYDCIDAAWRRLAAALGREKMRLGLKHLRKTSSTALGQHPQYKYYGGHFLADSPKGMDQKHYVRPNDVEFFSALDWLKDQLLGV